MKELSLLLESISIALIALFPLVSPIASGMVFGGLVPNADLPTMKALARKVAINSALFVLIFQIGGSYILRLFGISIPVLQVAGGLVLGGMGWSLLNEQDPDANTAAPVAASPESLQGMVFYPLTFPLSVGPGCMVAAITLGAQASNPSLLDSSLAHLGLLIGTVLICIATYLTHAYAHVLTAKVSSAALHGFLRLFGFLLVCIGGEIMWDGIQGLLKTIS